MKLKEYKLFTVVCNTNSDENFEFLTLPSTKKLKMSKHMIVFQFLCFEA